MLDAHAYGERLLLHVHARVAHELERVAGRMTARQHNAACGNQLGSDFDLGGFGFADPGLRGFQLGCLRLKDFGLADLGFCGRRLKGFCLNNFCLPALSLSGFRTVSATSPKCLGGLSVGYLGLG